MKQLQQHCFLKKIDYKETIDAVQKIIDSGILS